MRSRSTPTPSSWRPCRSRTSTTASTSSRATSARFTRSISGRSLFLYDNADIAAAGKSDHLHTRDVKRMSRLGYVRGVKVTAGKAVLGNYMRAASHFKRKGEFVIYPGNAYLIFDLFQPRKGMRGKIRHYWNRYLTQNSLPHGV